MFWTKKIAGGQWVRRVLRLVVLFLVSVPIAIDPTHAVAQTCPATDYELRSQNQVNAFPSSCSAVSGRLQITAPDVTDLSPLSALTSVGGDLWIEGNAALTDLNGLSAITSVGGEFRIVNNAALPNVNGLLGIATISGDLWITNNDNLTDLNGLSALASVGGDLWIRSNPALTDLNGLSAIISLPADLDIQANSALTNLGLSALTSIGGKLMVSGNNALTNLVGLSALTFVEGDLNISNSRALTDLNGLSALTTVGGDLNISVNAVLTDLNGLSAVTTVGAELSIFGNGSLTNLNGLSALTSVDSLRISSNNVLQSLDGLSVTLNALGGRLKIEANAMLKNIDGLSPLTSIGGNFEIISNGDLTHLDGLSNVTSVGGDLLVQSNFGLVACSCGLYEVTSSGGVSGSITMRSNTRGGDCNNDGADLVAGQCTSVGIEEDNAAGIPSEFSLRQNHPNPFNPTTTISYALPEAVDVTLTVHDLLGREVRELAPGTQPAGTYEVSFDASGLPSGIYFYRLQAGDFVETKRMVVVR